MNYLAHLILSEGQPGVMVGNFIGDLIKGNDWEALPQEIGIGVRLHRFIDHHADSHEIGAELRKVLRPYFGKFAGVALDIYMDHFLSLAWEEHCSIPISDFLKQCDQDFEPRRDQIPARAFNRWEVIYKNGWMQRYHSEEGLDEVFQGMRGRIRYDTGFERALEALTNHRETLESGFNDYFPVLRLASRERLRKLAGELGRP